MGPIRDEEVIESGEGRFEETPEQLIISGADAACTCLCLFHVGFRCCRIFFPNDISSAVKRK